MKKIIGIFLFLGVFLLSCVSYSLAQSVTPDNLKIKLVALDMDTYQAIQQGTTRVLLAVIVTNDTPNSYQNFNITGADVTVSDSVGHIADSGEIQFNNGGGPLSAFSSTIIYMPTGGLHLGNVSTQTALVGSVGLGLTLTLNSQKNSYNFRTQDIVYVPSPNMSLIPVISNQVNNTGTTVQNIWTKLNSCVPTSCKATYQCGSTVGVDNCGNSCSVASAGTCSAGLTCNASHVCSASCVSTACTASQQCGSTAGVDNCGNICVSTPGTCAAGKTCNASHVCA